MEREEDLIDWLREQQEKEGFLSLIGDDAAVLPRAETWAVTMDTQLEGVHFFPQTDPADVARRLLAVNLSDLAAMGANPAFAFLALAASPEFDYRRFFNALTDTAKAYDLQLAGGDLTRSDRCSAVLTLLGEKPLHQRWLKRGDALDGHRLWVGGTLGEAATGLALQQAGVAVQADGQLVQPEGMSLPSELRVAAVAAIRRHLMPSPQLALGQWLGRRSQGAAMDISDGLAKDLHRMCQESKVGALVDATQLPIPPACRALCQFLGHDPIELAISGGEDYVLLFTLPDGLHPPSELTCHAIGRIQAEPTVTLQNSHRDVLLDPRGWDHLST